MLKNNVVLITTICNTGTGILYPCKYKNKNKHANCYIIFTNRHVLKDIHDDELNQDVKKLLELQIYDDTGKVIDQDDILKILAFNPDLKKDKKEDVSALLVEIKDTVMITLKIDFFQGELENRSVLYTEGYPGILLNDEVSQKIQLQGISKSVFPENRMMGMFQITDDYHWYNNLQDKELFSGMSGGPVYVKYEGKIMLLGMNQSVSVIMEGHNPFKLVYYLRMEHILDCLRDGGCILFQRVGETEYQIEWVYGLKKEINEFVNEPSFLLIGGSGAGKSSFAKDFAYHGDNILSTNDGQTTRTVVIYEYSIFCEEPKVTVEFMNQEEFCERMTELQGVLPAIRVVRKIFGISKDIEKDELLFFQNCHHIIQFIQTHDKQEKNLLQEIEQYIEARESNVKIPPKNLIRSYEKLIEILVKYVPTPMVKYICDKNLLDNNKRSYQESYEKQYHPGVELQEQINQTTAEILQNAGVISTEETLKFGVILQNYFEGKIKFNEYQQQCMTYLNENESYFKRSPYERELPYQIKFVLDEYQKEYFEKLLYVEGFFDIKEFRFLKAFCNSTKDFWNDFECKIFLYKTKERIDKNNVDIHDIDIWGGTQEVYKTVHTELKKAIQEEYGVNGNVLKKEFSLTKMSDIEKRQLQLCLQVSGGNSLTGLIRSVKVEDMVSNNYAMLFSELDIAKIRMFDTYGLDHIDGIESMEDTLYHHIYYLTENEKVKFKDMNVLYIKKLDSGKPDELRVILPCVRKVIPQAPLYCVFTGIDIFYKTPEEVRGILWKKEDDGTDEKMPKPVRFILSDRGKNLLKGNEARDSEKNMYLVLKNNLVPYCGNRELVQRKYDYYKNNVTYVRRLLASIIMKEYSSLEIVDIAMFENRSKSMFGEIEKFILDIFKRASINVKNIHWNTIRANVYSINNKKLGACTSFRYQWNQRFHEAYAFIVTRDGEKIAQKYEISKDAIESALRNTEDLYLGTADNLSKIDTDDKNEFRNLLEEMYLPSNNIYKYNPFDISSKQWEEILSDHKLRKELFQDVFDFAKGIENNEELRKAFVKEFICQLTNQIQSDNEMKEQNIIHLDTSFADTIDRMRREFIEKYKWDENDEEHAKTNFKEMLKAYISNI